MNQINIIKSNKKAIGAILSAIIIVGAAFFDATLAFGIILIGLLALITFLIISALGIKSKALILLLLITFLVHFGMVTFMHYANFQPFSGGDGDYRLYDSTAKIIAERVRHGNFSLTGEGVFAPHLYPVIIGYIYALTVSEMFIGQLLDVWLAIISVLLAYLIVIEIGGSKKQAFFTGLIICFYPSYLFFGSLLLKDTLVVPLVLGGLLMTLKLVKKFSWINFLIFYIILGAVIHFRFYVGYALLLTFIFCWLLLYKMEIKKKFVFGAFIVIILGFLPQFLGHGYYGFDDVSYFLRPRIIVAYREETYNPSPCSSCLVGEKSPDETIAPISGKIDNPSPCSSCLVGEKSPDEANATIQVKTEINKPVSFLINLSKSFVYTLFGPLPWQIQNRRQMFALAEMIPWYFLLFFIARGSFVVLKKKLTALPLLVFSLITLGVLALFIPNFGITTRIRMPAFAALCCLIPLGWGKITDIKIPFIEKIFI